MGSKKAARARLVDVIHQAGNWLGEGGDGTGHVATSSPVGPTSSP